jgi:peptidoglycan-associated lipoprotein
MKVSRRVRENARLLFAAGVRKGGDLAAIQRMLELIQGSERMHKMITVAVLSSAILLAGCARKQAVNTVPPSVTEAVGATQDNDVGLVELPRLQAELVAAAGTDTIFFGTDRSDLDAEDRMVLDRQAAWLRANPNVRVSVEGHADERGTREYNQALGERRAQSARDYLVALGIPPARLLVVSWGKERPLDPGTGEQAWARNRRAVSVLVQ